jgi:hypothetical protein
VRAGTYTEISYLPLSLIPGVHCAHRVLRVGWVAAYLTGPCAVVIVEKRVVDWP